MQILSHRGYWDERIKPNSIEALKRAIDHGMGIETDIRDYCGKLVVSHDIADSSCCELEELLGYYKKVKSTVPLALNIKADGLAAKLKKMLLEFDIKNYFVFDMSFPQMLEYKDKNILFYTRKSEYEIDMLMYNDSIGVWYDAFYDDKLYDAKFIKSCEDAGKNVCIVSPELHKRDHKYVWKKLKDEMISCGNVFLCTDFPLEACELFGVERNG